MWFRGQKSGKYHSDSLNKRQNDALICFEYTRVRNFDTKNTVHKSIEKTCFSIRANSLLSLLRDKEGNQIRPTSQKCRK
jgi:hypothetical protein